MTIQELSIAAIVIDPELQPRVKTDMEHVAKLQAVIEEGVSITEPDVFFDEATGIYLMADGFHRHAAHVKLGRPSIRCRVHKGTRRDAMIFATRANVVHTGLMLSAKDKQKAARMLFADPEWWRKPAAIIAEYLNVADSTIKRHRLAYSQETGTPIPDRVETQDGRILPTRNQGDGELRRSPKRSRGKGRFQTRIDGRVVYLSTSRAESVRMLDEMTAEHRARRYCLHRIETSSTFLVERHIHHNYISAAGLFRSIAGRKLSLRGLRGDGWVAIPETFADPEGFANALGSVLWLRAACNVPRAVILCYREDAPAELFPAAESLGVEFLTPEEFVASVKPE